MKAMAMMPTRASGIAMMNASAMPWPYADSTTIRSVSGNSDTLGTSPDARLFSALDSAEVVGVNPDRESCMYVATLVESNDPMMVTPIVPAMVRKKLTFDDAAPNCLGE